MKKLIFIILFILLFQSVYASEEGVLPFSEFMIKSDGIGNSGPIVVKGKKDKSGLYVRLSVDAFGKKLFFPEDLLKQIPSKYQNGIQISYEAGYVQVGGRTVYIVFHQGFTSGIKQKFTISISENGSSEIIKD